MPGVPSGRGCDACRKQKKKVGRSHRDHFRDCGTNQHRSVMDNNPPARDAYDWV